MSLNTATEIIMAKLKFTSCSYKHVTTNLLGITLPTPLLAHNRILSTHSTNRFNEWLFFCLRALKPSRHTDRGQCFLTLIRVIKTKMLATRQDDVLSSA